MKKKEFKKKLSLNKLTISKLNEGALNNIKGGWPPTDYGCQNSMDVKCWYDATGKDIIDHVTVIMCF
jgi:hypothetical protein